MQAVHNVVEDSTGDVERLAAYNFEDSLSPEQVLPKHGIFAVKEPYYKLTADGGTSIRVDHPSDLVKLRPYDINVPAPLRTSVQDHKALTASALKGMGNAAFKQKKSQDALDHYTHALEICDDGQLLLRADSYRNRALVNLCLERYEAARADCNAAILDSSGEAAHLVTLNIRARYRGGRAAYGTIEFEGAKFEFQSVLAIPPSDADAIREHLPRTALHNLALWLCMAYAIEAPEKTLSMTLQLLRDLGLVATVSKSPVQKVLIDRSHARLEWAAVHAAMYACAVLEQQRQALAAKQMRGFGKEVYKTLEGSMCGFEEIFGQR